MARTTVVGACPHDCPDTCSILTTVEDGKAIAVRGNPDHPLSGGSTCAVGQASILGLYDSLRLAYPTKGGQQATWADVEGLHGWEVDNYQFSRGVDRLVEAAVHRGEEFGVAATDRLFAL